MGSRGRLACVVSAVLLELAAVAWMARGHPGGDRRVATWLPRLVLLQHAGAHALLAVGFASTLRPGREPLIGQVAARVHRLSPAMRAYTRRLTAAWVAYFATVAVASCAVYALVDVARWTWFAEIGTPVALAAMLFGEHRLRYRLHPEFERVGLTASLQAYRRSGRRSATARAPSA